ncbi:MAG: hypothetical protein HXY38_06275 [Chloroflexi bacterium]|nr:hypothetical protein [Chloroflexota bacterium]
MSDDRFAIRRVLRVNPPTVHKGETAMKLSLFFILFDLLILLAYPIVYVIHRLRRMKGIK